MISTTLLTGIRVGEREPLLVALRLYLSEIEDRLETVALNYLEEKEALLKGAIEELEAGAESISLREELLIEALLYYVKVAELRAKS